MHAVKGGGGSDSIGARLTEIFGLSADQVQDISIDVPCDDLVKVRITMLANQVQADGTLSVLKEYSLVPAGDE